MAIEATNANIKAFPPPAVASVPPDPAAGAAPPPADVTANVAFPEPVATTGVSPEQSALTPVETGVAPEPSALTPVENERGENIDTTA